MYSELPVISVKDITSIEKTQLKRKVPSIQLSIYKNLNKIARYLLKKNLKIIRTYILNSQKIRVTHIRHLRLKLIKILEYVSKLSTLVMLYINLQMINIKTITANIDRYLYIDVHVYMYIDMHIMCHRILLCMPQRDTLEHI